MERKVLADIIHNCRVTLYPDGSMTAFAAESPIMREPGWELSNKWDSIVEPREPRERDKAEDIERAQQRARKKVAEIARANPDMCYFVTFTLDGEKVDRYDVSECLKLLRVWCNNRVQRSGLKYIFIPEFHKDGALHFHGLINDAVDMVDSGTIVIDGGRPKKPRSKKQRLEWIENGGTIVYNIPEWSFGFTSCMKLYGDPAAAIGYVCKYIGKGTEKIGGRWYLSGGKLDKPTYVYTDVDWNKVIEQFGDNVYKISRLGVAAATLVLEQEDLNALVEPGGIDGAVRD